MVIFVIVMMVVVVIVMAVVVVVVAMVMWVLMMAVVAVEHVRDDTFVEAVRSKGSRRIYSQSALLRRHYQYLPQITRYLDLHLNIRSAEVVQHKIVAIIVCNKPY
jgi:type IV secretory pathway VirB3-like protein